MNTGMNFIVGVTLIVTQITSIRALDLHDQCENPLFSNYHFDDYPVIFQLISGANKLNNWPYSSERRTAQQLAGGLKSFAENMIIEDLKEALLTNDYRAVRDISDQIHLNSPKMFRGAIEEAVGSSFNDINISKFIKFFDCHQHAVQSVLGYSAMIEQLKSRNESNQSDLVTLAFNFKKAYDKLCSMSDHTEECSELSSLRDRLPRSLRNLVFEKALCIQSNKSLQYLYSADETPGSGSRRRLKTVAKLPQGSLQNVSWVVEPYKDVLHIKSFDSNEYIYVAEEYYDNDKNRINVELKNPSNALHSFGIHSEWIFEPSGDYMFIKNPAFKVYLLQETGKDVNDKDYVFASHDTFNESLWKMYAC